MLKVACVFSFKESTWISCQKIVFNLHLAYEQTTGLEITNYNYSDEEAWNSSVLSLVDSLYIANPDVIVIMDHKPHPVWFMKFLLPRYEGKKKPRLVFHVFGDFTLYYEDWSKLATLMEGFEVEFIVASDRQKILVDNFLRAPSSSVVCPFPVKTEDFSFLPAERTAQRKSWNVDENEIVFTYTGRLSRQKRIHLLLKTFDMALSLSEYSPARLYIYGQADDVGDKFLNIWDNENQYFRKFHRTFMELPERTRNRIHFMGNVPNSELRSVYAGADYLVNLSVHNDEDYGMSVAEAQMTGLPAILSDWGGLASFEHPSLPEATRFLKVSLGLKSKIISPADTVEALTHAMKSPRFKEKDRIKLMNLARGKFSIDAARDRLTSIYEKKSPTFVSFSELHRHVISRLNLKRGLYLNRNSQLSNLYRKIYSSYVRNS